MNKKIRIIAMILSHAALLLAIAFLIFFAVCSARAKKTAEKVETVGDSSAEISEKDLYLEKAMRDNDFSVVTVGRALSEKSDSGRELMLWIVDLILPVLCIAAGVFLQLAATDRKRRNAAAQHPSPDYHNRRAS